MPKTLTPAIRAHLDAETTRLAAIWRIMRKDGQRFFFTDHDRDIVFAAKPGIQAIKADQELANFRFRAKNTWIDGGHVAVHSCETPCCGFMPRRGAAQAAPL
jgi:hypothetical protein